MNEFYITLSEFFESDCMKTYGWLILTAFINVVVISWAIMGFIFLKVIVPAKTIEANNIKRDNKMLSEKVEEMTRELDKLKEEKKKLEEKIQHFEVQEALEYNGETIIRRKAFNEFT